MSGRSRVTVAFNRMPQKVAMMTAELPADTRMMGIVHPAAASAQGHSPWTAVGVPVSVRLGSLSPSSPELSSPQQNACWLAFRAHALPPKLEEMPTVPLEENPPTMSGVALKEGVPT